MHWSVSSHSLACLLVCETVMSTLWKTSLTLWELSDHRDNFPQFFSSIPQPLFLQHRYIQESACPPARVQCLCQLSLSRGLDATCICGLSVTTGIVLLPLESFSISCCSRLWCREKQIREQGYLKAISAECILRAAAQARDARLGRGTCVLKHHWNLAAFVISTSCRLCNVQIIYFGLGREKAKHPAFTCLFFGLFHNSWNTNKQLLACWPRLF